MYFFNRLLFVASICGALYSSSVWAQSSASNQASYQLSDEDTYATVSAVNSNSAASDDCGCCPCEDEVVEVDDGWKLMDLFEDCCGNNCLAEKGITIAGWVEMGYQSQPDGAFTGNGAFLDDREDSKVNVNEAYLYAEKVADGTKGLDWGFRADVIYGVDGNEAQSFGNRPGNFDFLNGWDHGIYEWALPQLYGEFAYEDLSVKIGHFYTPTGYEVIPPAKNFFFSRQITWYQGEPFTHTGVLGSYKVNDKLSLTSGWALGWDTGFDQFNGGNMALVGASYVASEDVSLSYFGGYGNFGWRGTRGLLTGVIATLDWTEKITTIHQFDVLDTNNDADPVAPGGDFATDGIVGDDVALVNYLIYHINDKWHAGTRSEWYKADGISYYTLTYGLNFQPRPNLLIRPEMRHLWAPGVPGGAPGTIAANVAQVYDKNDVFGIDSVWSF